MPGVPSGHPLLLTIDLDGTLVDSIGDLAAAAAELVRELGGRPPDPAEVALMVGEGAGTLVGRVLSAGGLAPDTPGAVARYLEIYDTRLLETSVVYQGIPDALARVARHARMAVLTNKPMAPTMRMLDALLLTPFFETVMGGDGPHGRKPDPAGLRALAAGAAAVAHVGDSPIDWETALAAGCPFVWARYGFGSARFTSDPETPWIVDRPSDLPAVVERLIASFDGR